MIKRTTLRLLIMAAALIILTACDKKQYDKEQIRKVICDNLYEKYKEQFEISEINKVDTGINFAEFSYNAEAISMKTTKECNVHIDIDGQNMKDNYEGVLYNNKLEDFFNTNILSQTENMTFEQYELVCSLKDTKSNSFEEWMSNGGVMLQATIQMDQYSNDEAAHIIYELVDSLQKNAIEYSLCIYIGNNERPLVLYHELADETYTEEKLLDKLN